MARLPYDVVAIEADKLYKKMLSAKTPEELDELYISYIDYLHATGWDSWSFNQESLARMGGWEEEVPTPKSKPN